MIREIVAGQEKRAKKKRGLEEREWMEDPSKERDSILKVEGRKGAV